MAVPVNEQVPAVIASRSGPARIEARAAFLLPRYLTDHYTLCTCGPGTSVLVSALGPGVHRWRESSSAGLGPQSSAISFRPAFAIERVAGAGKNSLPPHLPS